MRFATIFSTAILSAVLLAGCTKESNPVLTIEGGQIQGVESGIDGVFVYKGIPFAAPPESPSMPISSPTPCRTTKPVPTT